jgi:5-methylcytosine-specific restriction protein A
MGQSQKMRLARFIMGGIMKRLCVCGELVEKGETCICQQAKIKARQREADAKRGSAHARGYNQKWRIESKRFLALPGNERCACGCGRPANVVDHKVAHKGNKALFWDKTNWQAMNVACNSRKNVRHEGGFGRKPAP